MTLVEHQTVSKAKIVGEGRNPKFTDTVTTSGRGNISNKAQTSDVCGGTGGGKCPPGQFQVVPEGQQQVKGLATRFGPSLAESNY